MSRADGATPATRTTKQAPKGSRFRCSGTEGFTFFVVVRRRVHVLGALVRKGSKGFAFFVLGCGRVHVFRRRAPKGSRFRCSGAEWFGRVRVFRSRVRKGSHFSSSSAGGFAFFYMWVAQETEGSNFLPGDRKKNLVSKNGKKSGVQKMRFPYLALF